MKINHFPTPADGPLNEDYASVAEWLNELARQVISLLQSIKAFMDDVGIQINIIEMIMGG